jgi:transcriptional regulator with GAF, ATPase, and Fis domain
VSESGRFAELQRRYERLRRSVALFRELAQSSDTDTLLDRLLSGIVAEFPVHAAFVGRLHRSSGRMNIRATHDEVAGRTPPQLPLTNPLLAKLLKSRTGTMLLTSREQAGADGFFYGDSASSMSFRFHFEGDEPDIVVLESREAGAFSADDLHFVEDLLQSLSTTLFNRYARVRTDRELGLVLDVARTEAEVERTLDEAELGVLLDNLLQLALSRTQCRTGALLLLDEESGDLLIEAETFSLDREEPVPRRMKRRGGGRRSGIVFRVLDDGRTYLANRVQDDVYYLPLLDSTSSALAVPMVFQHRPIGVIHVESPRDDHFTPDHQDLLERLARTATSFVRRAQLARSVASDGSRSVGVLIKGRGPQWAAVEHRIERAAATPATVCLRGESGTGKELVAHAIHFNSERAKAPFVTVNCAAIPRELLESELFGHVRGAFTGAVADRAGQFQAAAGGTIFLDEIGDLAPELQVKLLRVLQSGELRMVGSDSVRRVDVRVIAATSRDLETMMGQGLFREDLYYRLMVVPIQLPPLRDYPGSIPGMVKQFVRDANVRYGRSVVGVADEVARRLKRHPFPGNVRELRNLVEQGVLMTDGAYIEIADMPPYIRGEAPSPPMPGSLIGSAPGVRAIPPVARVVLNDSELSPLSPAAFGFADAPTPPGLSTADVISPIATASTDWDYKALKDDVLRRFEERFLDSLLSATAGNVTRAAELAGIHRVQLHRMIRRREAADA